MAKKTTKPKKPAPKVEMIEIDEESIRETHGKGQSTHGKVTKSQAVRLAIADGVDNPVDGVAYILNKFGLELSPTHFSAVKSADKRKGPGPKGKPGRKPKSQTPSNMRGGDANLLQAMEAMKPLVDSLGKEQVHRIIDLLG